MGYRALNFKPNLASPDGMVKAIVAFAHRRAPHGQRLLRFALPGIPPQRFTNRAPIMALVAAEIAVLLTCLGTWLLRESGPVICKYLRSQVLPSVAMAGQSPATCIMDSGRRGAPPDQPRNTRAQFTPRRCDDDEIPG